MKKHLVPLLAALAVAPLAQAMENGDVRNTDGALQVWSEARQAWVEPPLFFADDLKTLNGPTYGRTSTYPPYEQVSEWDTLIDLLPDGRECPMVFFHQRWRRLADVRALDDQLRNFGGCRDVFKF